MANPWTAKLDLEQIQLPHDPLTNKQKSWIDIAADKKKQKTNLKQNFINYNTNRSIGAIPNDADGQWILSSHLNDSGRNSEQLITPSCHTAFWNSFTTLNPKRTQERGNCCLHNAAQSPSRLVIVQLSLMRLLQVSSGADQHGPQNKTQQHWLAAYIYLKDCLAPLLKHSLKAFVIPLLGNVTIW